MSNIIYLNGEFLAIQDAKVSPMDRGFLFADGVYETIPVYAGKPFRLQQHLQRLQRSLDAIQLKIPLSLIELEKILLELIARNSSQSNQSKSNLSIYLQCTRGSVEVREHAFPENSCPTIFAYCAPIAPRSITELSHGIHAITVEDLRWQHCDIKSVNLLANVLARQQAVAAHAHEAILIRDNFALEGSASNLFIVKNNVIQTPPLNQFILGGVTRELVLELAIAQGYSCEEKNISLQELQTADEIWLTSSTREIMPVIKLNDKLINDGKAGDVWQKLIAEYKEFIGNQHH